MKPNNHHHTDIQKQVGKTTARRPSLWKLLLIVFIVGALFMPSTGVGVAQTSSADLSVTMTVSSTRPLAGDTVNFTVVVTNNGPDNATGVVVGMDLSYHLVYGFSSPSQGAYDLEAGEWAVDGLAAGGSATLVVTTTLLEGATFENIANIIAAVEMDPILTNNTATVRIAGYQPFAAGACVIDMGGTTQAAGLKPYGLIYQLVETYQVPVYWSINPDKAKDGADFTVNGKNYRGGSFIIPAEYVPTAQTAITTWRTKGALIDCNLPAFTAPIYNYVTSMPNSVLDEDNGAIAAAAFFTPAEIPTTAYKIGGPEDLVDCDDVYYMPHADPHLWPATTKAIFEQYIMDGGSLFAACHSPSSLESPLYTNMPFLSTPGLLDWRSHADASGILPYQYDPATADDPLMQHIGRVDGALNGGSEEIYMPVLGGAWRPTTTVAVWDPRQADVLAGRSPGKAALLAYGRAYGNPDYGMIVYEASHTFQQGTVAENTAAARTLGNLLLISGIESRPQISASIPDYVQAGQTVYVSASIEGGSPPYSYTWSNTCGGTFGDPNAAFTSFTAPVVTNQTPCLVRLVVEDQCNRTNFKGKAVVINKAANLELQKESSPEKAAAGDLVTFTILPQYTGTLGLINGVVTDVVPAGMTFVSAGAGGVYDPGTNTVTWSLGTNLQPVDGVISGYPTGSGIEVFYAAADTWVDQRNPATNYGTSVDLVVTTKAGEISNSLVRFDLGSKIPPGATVDTAELWMYLATARNNNNATVYRMITPWTESGATWGDSNGASAGDWVTGTFSASDYAGTTSYGTILNTPTGWKTVTLTNLVRGWYNGTFTNNGLVLLAGGTDTGDAKYSARETATTNLDPQLRVNWSRSATTATLVELSAEPMVITGSGKVTVTMDVTATYNNSPVVVTPPAALSVSPGVTGTLVGSPSPASSQIIPMGGGTVSFTYVYNVTAGSSPVQATFSGVPSSTSAGISFNTATSNSVITTPGLTLLARVNSPLELSMTSIPNTARVCDTNSFAAPNCQTADTIVDLFYLGATIGDRVWLDENSDGVQDAGEAGIANVKVIAIWYGPDGMPGGGDDVIYTTWTDSNGAYSFSNMPPGNYAVAVDTATLADGLEANPTYDSDGISSMHTATLTLADGQTSSVAYFGYNWTATTDVANNTGTGAIGDSLWVDADGNGIRDPGEPGLGGVTVTLFTDPDGNGVYDTAAAATTSGPDGSYIFDNLPVGSYVVQVTPPAGYTPTGDPDGTFDNKSTAPILLSPGDVYVNSDFGYMPDAGYGATIGDAIWLDADGDGMQDAGEEGIAGVTVSLIQDLDGDGIWDPGEPIIAATVSDQNGEYAFNGVPVGGDYLVWVNDTNQLLAGMQATYDAEGTITPNISAVTDLPAAGNADQIFGYAPASQVDANGSIISSTIWYDANNDGVLDPDEAPIPGVVMVLTDNQGNTWTTTTDANGNYYFGDLPVGVYTLTVSPGNFAAGGALYGTNANTFDADGNFDNSSTVTLATNSSVELDLNFGYYGADPAPNLVSSQVFIDADGDGKQDAGEPVIPGVVVQLTWYGPDGVVGGGDDVVYTTVTDANGTYTFDDLPDGYFEITTNLPVNTADGGVLNNLTPTDPGQTATKVFSLDPNGDTATGAFEINQDLGASPSDNAGDTGFIRSAIWFDTDSDGMRDAGEVGIPGVLVTLTDGTNTWTTTTDANGNYSFGDLPAGTYSVTVDASNFAPGGPLYGTSNTYDANGGLNSTSSVTLATDASVNLVQNFGYYSAANPLSNSVTSAVFTDSDGDGLQDAGEPGIPGVLVQLTWYGPDGILGGGDDVNYATVTDANGYYSFENLPDGTFSITTDLLANTNDGGVLSNLNPTDTGLNRSIDFSLDPTHASAAGVTSSEDLTLGNSPSEFSTAIGLIGQSIFLDLDGNGMQNAGEGLEGIRVELYDAGGNLVMTRYTDATGSYYFGGFESGTYTVRVDTASLPAGLTNSVDPDGLADSSTQITITAEQPTSMLADFGYAASNPNILSGTIWNDQDGDGYLDETGTGLGGVTVALYDANGNMFATTTTAADGSYTFGGLPDGTYRVDVTDLYNVLDGSWHTLGQPGVDGNSQPDPLTLVLSGGVTASYADFGYIIDKPSAGDRVFYDADGDGIQDVGEPGIPNVPVTLTVTYPNGATATSVVLTDSSGQYSFSNMLLDEDYDGVGTFGSGGTEPLYVIEVGTPSRYIVSPAYQGGDPALDSGDSLSGEQTLPVLGISDTAVDFGFYQVDLGDGPVSYDGTTAPANLLYPDTTGDGLPDSLGSTPAIWLGTWVDGETTAAPTASANGDNLDYSNDEDGVDMVNGTSWAVGEDGGTLSVDLSSSSAGTESSGYLVVWFDWNHDGDFADAGEMTISTAVSWTGTATQTVIFDIPDYSNALMQDLIFRARLFTAMPADPATAYGGLAVNGETEDYYAPVTTLPVTMNYFTAVNKGGTVKFDWSTGTETGNIGFNLYLATANGYQKLNPEMIPSTGFTTHDPQDYHYEARLGTLSKTAEFYLEDVDIQGRSRMHGPFVLGEVNGARVVGKTTNWDGIRAESNRLLAERNTKNSMSVNEGLQDRIGGDGVESQLLPTPFEAPKDMGKSRPINPPKPTPTATRTPTLTAMPSNTPIPTATPTETPLPTYTPLPTEEPTLTPTETAAPVETETQTPVETDTPQPTATSTPEPTATEVVEPTPTEVFEPTATATAEPSPTVEPSPTATAEPTPTAAAGMRVGDLLVSQTGIQRVTYEDLLAAGLDLNGQPAADIALTLRGAAVPVTVGGAEVFGPGSTIEFFGQALESQYTDTNVYTLWVDRTKAQRVPEDATPYDPAGVPAAFYMETALVDLNKAYDSLSSTGDPWYNTRMVVLSAAKSWTFPLTVDHYLAGLAQVGLKVDVYGGTNYPTSPDHHMVASFNGAQVADRSFDALDTERIDALVPEGKLVEGSNTLTLKLPADTGQYADVVYLDQYSVSYPRAFWALNGRLIFESSAAGYQVDNLPDESVVVYRLTDGSVERLSAAEVIAQNGTYSVRFAGSEQAGTYYVSAAGALWKPGIRAGRAQVDITSGTADYLIISHPNFIAGLDTLVQARTAQGLRVRVVNVEDIYAQFSYGVFDPAAIREYIRHAAGNMGTQYVLLVGDDTYDYKNYANTGSISFIPSIYMAVGDLVQYAPVDPKYVDLDDDNIPDLPIGRFAVRTVKELTNVISKTLTYDIKNYGKTSVFAADWNYGDESDALAAKLPPGWSTTKAYLDFVGVSQAHTALVQKINAGMALTSFVGHSDDWQWTWDGLFTIDDAPGLTNIGRPTLVTQNGCYNIYYVNPEYETLGDAMMNNGLQGAAAMFGSTTLTSDANEQKLGDLFMPLLTRPGTTVGQAMLISKRALAASDPDALDVLLGWSLLGDPYLKVTP